MARGFAAKRLDDQMSVPSAEVLGHRTAHLLLLEFFWVNGDDKQLVEFGVVDVGKLKWTLELYTNVCWF